MKVPSIQFHFRQKTYQLRFRIGFFLLCAFFFILFCILGNWQLHRYHYKQNLQQLYKQQLASSPQSLSQLNGPTENLQFQSVRLEGRYLNAWTLLLQNQFYKDQLGFDVLTPMQIPGDKKLVLIDRGWIQQPANQTKPAIQSVDEIQKISGYIKLIDNRQFILGKNILDKTNKPIVIQKIDIEEISQITHQEFYPFIIRLNASAPNGYTRDWSIVTVMPERHMGYAVQWFAMAFALLIAYFCFCCERIQTERDEKHAK